MDAHTQASATDRLTDAFLLRLGGERYCGNGK